MPSLETFCTECQQGVGLMNAYRGPNAHRGPRKRTVHGDPQLPKRNGRMARCPGSCLEVPDEAIYEVQQNRENRRRQRTEADA